MSDRYEQPERGSYTDRWDVVLNRNFAEIGDDVDQLFEEVETVHNVKAHGAKGDGVTDDTQAIQDAINAAIADNGTVFLPPGTYVVTQLSAAEIDDSLAFVGAGDSVTTLKRKDDSLSGNFEQTLRFSDATGVSDVHLYVADFSVDDNARNQIEPPSHDGFAYEHSGAIWIECQEDSGFGIVKIENLHVTDCVADGVGILGNAHGTVLLSNITEGVRNRVRAGITLTASYDDVIISNCSVKRFWHETNAATVGYAHDTVIDNLVTEESFEISVKTAENLVRLPYVTVANSQLKGAIKYLYGAEFRFTNCVFESTDGILRLRDPSRYAFSECKIADRTTTQDHLIEAYGGTEPEYIKFAGCRFDTHAGSSLLSYLCIEHGNEVLLDGCQFYGDIQKFIFRGGVHYIRDCDLYGDATHFEMYEQSGSNTSENHFHDNHVHHANAWLYTPSAGDNNEVWMGGNTTATPGHVWNSARSDWIREPRGSRAGDRNYIHSVDSVELEAMPTEGHWLNGQRIYAHDPTAINAVGWVATNNGVDTAANTTFQTFGTL